MSETCELCGRAMATKMILPAWWQHGPVCRRKRCQIAAEEALDAILSAREEYNTLVGQIAVRHEAQHAPCGYRQDAMADIEREEDEWWATEIVKRV